MISPGLDLINTNQHLIDDNNGNYIGALYGCSLRPIDPEGKTDD